MVLNFAHFISLLLPKVAIKIIDKKQAMEDRYVSKNMRREAKILQMVRHQNVIHLLEVVETENR